ncbi:MFS transporter [Acidithiobacillus sp.]|jgi:DHA1 family multidrug resistance protein-like MFS transporter|uniref:MFS transporter n=1 Tax=Acidithiobacillus sp. TaxID=1872118 RepID=UPI00356B4849
MNGRFFIVVCLTVAVNAGMGLIVPILPAFLQSYGFSVAELSLPFVSLIIGRMLSKTCAAQIIALLSNKVTLVVSFLLYGLVFACYPLVEHAYGFIALRFFEGVVEGISIICLTDLAIVLSKESRGKLMGIFGSSFGIGFMVGPLLGGVCYELGGTTAMFAAGAVMGGLGALLSLLVPAIEQVPPKRNNWLLPTMEHMKFLPEYGPSIIRRVVFFCFMIVLPLYATRQMDLKPTDVAMYFTVSAVLSASLMPFTGKLADRIPAEKILALSLPLMAVLIMAFGLSGNAVLFTALFLMESMVFALMLPAGMKVFAEAVNGHPERTEIISSFGGLTEALTLPLAVLIPWLYTVSPLLTWVAIGAICALSGAPFVKRVMLGRALAPAAD